VSLLGSLRNILVGASSDGLIGQHLSIQIKTGGAQVEFVLAESRIIETVLGNLSKALAEFSLGFNAWDVSSISGNYVVLGFLGFLIRKVSQMRFLKTIHQCKNWHKRFCTCFHQSRQRICH